MSHFIDTYYFPDTKNLRVRLDYDYDAPHPVLDTYEPCEYVLVDMHDTPYRHLSTFEGDLEFNPQYKNKNKTTFFRVKNYLKYVFEVLQENNPSFNRKDILVAFQKVADRNGLVMAPYGVHNQQAYQPTYGFIFMPNHSIHSQEHVQKDALLTTMFLNGDVFSATLEEETVWSNEDNPTQTLTTWEPVDAVHGFYLENGDTSTFKPENFF